MSEKREARNSRTQRRKSPGAGMQSATKVNEDPSWSTIIARRCLEAGVESFAWSAGSSPHSIGSFGCDGLEEEDPGQGYEETCAEPFLVQQPTAPPPEVADAPPPPPTVTHAAAPSPRVSNQNPVSARAAMVALYQGSPTRSPKPRKRRRGPIAAKEITNSGSSASLPPLAKQIWAPPRPWAEIEAEVRHKGEELARPVEHTMWKPRPEDLLSVCDKLQRDGVHRFAPSPLPPKSGFDMYRRSVETADYNCKTTLSPIATPRARSPRSSSRLRHGDDFEDRRRPPQSKESLELEQWRRKLADSAIRLGRTSDMPHSLLLRCGAMVLG